MARDQEAVRITTAAASRNADIAQRQRRYLFSMGIRTLCFVGAVVASGWLRWVLVTAALILPYVAVVMANAAAGRSEVALTGTVSDRKELSPGPGSGGPDHGPDGI